MRNQNISNLQLMVLSSFFAALIAIGAQLVIPLPFVPITLQTFFVLLASVFLGGFRGSLSIFIYLLIGIAGFPVFSSGTSGLGVILGPTGGYLYSFLIASIIVGVISDKIFLKYDSPSLKSLALLFVACLLGSMIILAIGTIHLMIFVNLSPEVAFFSGFFPFILGDVVKSLAVALVMSQIYTKRPIQNTT
ncbi:MAG: biotin transporter BioY [Methanosarcinaceae archaeon]|nr:biotin transporter BioY [Methanosarcinaceae archaeon]